MHGRSFWNQPKRRHDGKPLGICSPPSDRFWFLRASRWSFEITFVLVSPPLLSVSGFYFVLVDGDLVFGHDESRSLADVLE
jgi:hypothetical protein